MFVFLNVYRVYVFCLCIWICKMYYIGRLYAHFLVWKCLTIIENSVLIEFCASPYRGIYIFIYTYIGSCHKVLSHHFAYGWICTCSICSRVIGQTAFEINLILSILSFQDGGHNGWA